MSEAAETLLKQALTLPADDRVKLASSLLASLDDEPLDENEVERLWSQETERRMALLQTGEAHAVTSEAVSDGLAALRAERLG